MRFLSARDIVVEQKNTKRAPIILALGLPRCATSSLQAAFEQIGLYPCMHMAEIVPYVDRLKKVNLAVELLIGENFEREKVQRQKVLHELFDGWTATSDFPGMLFVEDLMDMYPDAKILLNKRENASAWASSIQRTLQFFASRTFAYTTWLWPTDYYHTRIWKKVPAATLSLYGHEEFCDEKTFDAHTERVLQAAKQRNREVVEWTPSMGWEPICALVGKPAPQSSFPRLNDEATVKIITRILMARGILSWAAVLSAPAVLYWAGLKYGRSLLAAVV